jgi:tRNA (cmo5U34)-methyltransferase
MQPFDDPATVANYAQSTPSRVPGFADLHRMAVILLAEHAGSRGEILVVGAGGGLELKAFAEARPGWRFVGVDPSAAMIDLARHTLGSLQSRVELQEGYVDTAPEGPFDGAACLLTLHFLQRDERLHTLRQIRRRLKAGARLVVAHHCAPPGSEASAWLARSIAFAASTSTDSAQALASAAAMADHLPLLPVAEEEALLGAAGFSEVALFYAAFSFRGWIAVA